MQAPIPLLQLDLAGEENSGAPLTTEPEQRGLGCDQRGPCWVRSQKTEDKKILEITFGAIIILQKWFCVIVNNEDDDGRGTLAQDIPNWLRQ